MDVEVVTRNYMLYFLLPLWIIPGLMDWWCHRRTRIEATSGTTESLIHLLMMAEIAIPITMGLLLEINALAISIMIAAFFVHEATAFWDVAYAEAHREVTPTEQHIHSFLEVLPFMAVSFVICLHSDQFFAIFGAGEHAARWAIRLKEPHLSVAYLVALFGSIGVFLGLPYAEELWRCLQAKAGRRSAEVVNSAVSDERCE